MLKFIKPALVLSMALLGLVACSKEENKQPQAEQSMQSSQDKQHSSSQMAPIPGHQAPAQEAPAQEAPAQEAQPATDMQHNAPAMNGQAAQ